MALVLALGACKKTTDPALVIETAPVELHPAALDWYRDTKT